MVDEIQNIINSNKLNINELYDIADKNKSDRFKRKITNIFEEVKDIKVNYSYIKYLSRMYLNRKRITNKDIMLFLIMLEYLKLDIKTNDLKLFDEIVDIAYKHAENECKKVLGQAKKIRPINILNLWLMSMPNHLGNVWSDYIQNEINYNTNQLFKQIMIDMSQNNDIDLDDDEYRNIFNKQQKTHFNINDDKYSGAVETQTDYLVNKTILEVGKDYGMQKCRLIAEIDKRTTDMCETLNNQIFNLNDWNTYQRYSAVDDKMITYKTFGLVLGENLPPINNHFHYCRSTITYQIDIPRDELNENLITWNEESALYRYLGGKSGVLNEKMRDKKRLTTEEKIYRKDLYRALNKMPYYNGDIVRVVDINDSEKLNKFLNEYSVNNVVRFNQFTSFSNKNGYNVDANINIWVHNSKKARDVIKYSQESELLYQYGTKFKVLDVVEQNSKYYILLEELDD